MIGRGGYGLEACKVSWLGGRTGGIAWKGRVFSR